MNKSHNITGLLLLMTLSQLLTCVVSSYGHGAVHERLEIVNVEINAQPNNAELYAKRADLYIEHDEFELALADLSTAESLAGKGFDAYQLVYGKAYLKMGMPDRAIEFVDEFLEDKENYVMALQLKADILESQGKYDEAIFNLEKILSHVDKRIPENYLSIIYLLENQENLDYNYAYKILDRAEADLGPIIVFEQKRLDLLKKEGNVAGALSLIDEIMATQNRKERWHFMKAELLYNNEDIEKAKLEYLNTKLAISELSNRMKNTPAMRSLLEQARSKLNYIETTLNENPTSFKQKPLQKE